VLIGPTGGRLRDDLRSDHARPRARVRWRMISRARPTHGCERGRRLMPPSHGAGGVHAWMAGRCVKEGAMDETRE
jgi:hypothetical protein